MFSNFLYFIVVLLIYLSYQFPERPNFAPGETLVIFLALHALFFLLTWYPFRRLVKQARTEHVLSENYRLDSRFNALLTRQMIAAVVLFAADIYGLSLPWFVAGSSFFQLFPTLAALLFLGIFILYLALIWAAAYDAQRLIYGTDISRGAYVAANISISVPVLLPWLALSITLDIINLLPFEWPRRFLATPVGEIFYFLLFLFLVAAFGPLLIQKFWRCRPLEPGEKRRRIEALCRRANLEYREIMYWPLFGGGMITAGVMGLMKRFRYILVTEAMLRYLAPEEIDAVIAHEIGHVKRHHLFFYLLLFAAFFLLFYSLLDTVLYLAPWFVPIVGLNHLALIPTFVFILIFLIYFRFIFGYFMRNFERQADAFVYTLFRSARPLITTFRKIAVTSGQSPDRPNWHHFSISERIGFLERCETDRVHADRHERKIRRSITAFGAAVLIIGTAAFSLGPTASDRILEPEVLARLLVREIEASPADPELYRLLGDVYYDGGEYARAVDAYRMSLELNPENPEVLNNLAWLYATADSLRDPDRALSLAQKAASLSDAPHILDTLAESYFINGQVEKAVEVEKEALEKARENHAYFRGQLTRFEEALAGGSGQSS